VKKVFWTLFVAMAGLVLALAWVVDPGMAQQVVGMIIGLNRDQECTEIMPSAFSKNLSGVCHRHRLIVHRFNKNF
jgi:hypothetical protein